MKKLAVVIICLLLTLTLAISCGGGEKNANPTGPEKTGTGDGGTNVEENGEQAIKYNDKWFRNFEEFCQKAEIGKDKFTSVYDEIYVKEATK